MSWLKHIVKRRRQMNLLAYGLSKRQRLSSRGGVIRFR